MAAPSINYALTHYVWCDVCGSRWYAHRGLHQSRLHATGKALPRAGSVAQGRMDSAALDGCAPT